VVVIALLTIIFMTILIYTKKNRFSPLAIIIPSGYLCYLLVISPWGFPTYIYSPLTPYIMGIFFPLYVWLNNKTKVIKVVTNVMLVFLVSIACVAIIIPRIARMGDLRRAVEFITEFSGNNPGSVYFYPTPFPESAGSMKKLTQAEIILIAGGNLNKKLAGKPDSAYLLIENWCNPVTLQDVRVDELIYDGNTWKIFRLIAEDGYQEKFKVKFPQNIAQKTKNYFKRIK